MLICAPFSLVFHSPFLRKIFVRSKSSNMPSDVIFDKKFTLFGLAVYRYWKSPTKKKLSILGIPVYSWRKSGYSITYPFLFFRWKTKKRFQQLYDTQNRILSELIAVCNAQKEANAALKSKLVTVGAGLADLQKQHDALANRLVLLAEMIHGISRSNRAKPCICIVSPNFAGGGGLRDGLIILLIALRINMSSCWQQNAPEKTC